MKRKLRQDELMRAPRIWHERCFPSRLGTDYKDIPAEVRKNRRLEVDLGVGRSENGKRTTKAVISILIACKLWLR